MMRKFWFVVICLVSVARLADARRNFFVEKEVRCGAGQVCYLKADGRPLNGKLHQYYPNGVTRSITEYRDGVRFGDEELYYADGKPRAYFVYQNGMIHGNATTYYNNGNTEYETSYEAGVMHGVRKGFYQDGTLKFETDYVNGVRNGRERRYYANGKILGDIVFDMGRPVRATCRTLDGQFIDFTDTAEQYINTERTPCNSHSAP
ncbi:MAG: toxin-antitoxin system YwqK family antitoxin [Acetobacter sp.]|nr:toxin-antitoxin system YwqK family antitoxin [Acetobacter sp.]